MEPGQRVPEATEAPTAGRVAQARDSGERALAWCRARVPGAEIAFQAVERDRVAAAGLIAGGLAFRFFLWLVPFGLVLSVVLGYWVETDAEGLEETAKDFGLGAVAAASASDAVEHAHFDRWYLLVIGVTLVAYFSIGAVRALRVAHFVAWQQKPERLRRPISAAAAFNGIVIALLAATTATALLREQVETGGLLITVALLAAYVALAIWVLTLLPHADAPWTALVPGAVLIAVGGQAIHLIVVLYLAPKLGRSTALYGTLGAATVVMLWLYFVARLFVAAAFLNASRWDGARAD